jgi:2-polyprenyl-3-methyl-5-hydroxy-6-metoxy-1,4-benzoquinol methylase
MNALNGEILDMAVADLSWERRYKLRDRGDDGGGYFLPEISYLDSDFSDALTVHGPCAGKLLDVGAGLGSQAVQYAQLGFDVTAIDVSKTALGHAENLAKSKGAKIKFLIDNILMTKLDDSFDIICDRGCLTILRDKVLGLYAKNLYKLIRPSGHALVKVDEKSNNKVSALLDLFDVVADLSGYYEKSIDNPTNNLHRSHFYIFRPKVALGTPNNER